jgi:hypothetical protein
MPVGRTWVVTGCGPSKARIRAMAAASSPVRIVYAMVAAAPVSGALAGGNGPARLEAPVWPVGGFLPGLVHVMPEGGEVAG